MGHDLASYRPYGPVSHRSFTLIEKRLKKATPRRDFLSRPRSTSGKRQPPDESFRKLETIVRLALLALPPYVYSTYLGDGDLQQVRKGSV